MQRHPIDSYGEAIERLLKECADGADLHIATSGEARLARTWETALSRVADMLRDRLGTESDARLQLTPYVIQYFKQK
jgi:hypothetical protein